MKKISYILGIIDSILSSNPFLLAVFLSIGFFKIFILSSLIKKIPTAPLAKKSVYLLCCLLTCSLISDFAWVFKLVRDLFVPSIDFRIYTLVIRVAWAFTIFQYQSMGLFVESLFTKNLLSLKNKILLLISSVVFAFFMCVTILYFNGTSGNMQPWFEFSMRQIEAFFALFFIMLPALISAVIKLRKNQLPSLLSKQLKIFIGVIFIPYWILDFLQISKQLKIFIEFSHNWFLNSYTFVSISNIFLCYAIYYCTRKIIGLRFLNFTSHVQAPVRLSFLDDFKVILERFSKVSTIHELKHITQSFFKESFEIPLTKISLYIRKSAINKTTENTISEDQLMQLAEVFLCAHEDKLHTYIHTQKILIYDEIAFSNFYEEDSARSSILQFMNTINADIFVPVFDKEKMIAYIIIERFARFDRFYSDTERDQMLVFASYLGNLINLIYNKNINSIIEQTNNLKQELYFKHQEINQYKESIRSFLRNNRHTDIGIIFYKNRNFAFGNKAARDLIKINPNQQEGHPLAKALKQVAQQVETYKSPQSLFSKDNDGNQLVLSGVPNLEQNNVIITVHYPEIADIIKKQMDLLKDPSEWDYLLYLETTKSGKLINQLIPSSGEKLLNFKIELLKIALSKKAILLDMPEEDIESTLHILHHISLRETLEIIALTAPIRTLDIITKLFGINPIFAPKNQERPLLEKLDSIGTLFIKNIHFLDIDTQEHLAEFIRCGFFRIFKSEQCIASDVRIIASSNQNLSALVQEGKFSQALFNELKHTMLSMPSLMVLSEDELQTLAQGYSEQAIKSQAFKNLLELTTREKDKLVTDRPTSLQEMKTKVHSLLLRKSKKSHVEEETKFDPAYEISDPQLIEAARMGKYALKDEKTMNLLWQKFKSQNKIASFLGVNRSSVNRRCKKYGFE